MNGRSECSYGGDSGVLIDILIWQETVWLLVMTRRSYD